MVSRGIHSARYADTAQARIDKLLDVLKDVPSENRGAKFVCARFLWIKTVKFLFSDRGECFWKIGFEAKGKWIWL